jgi:hypothetical protein
MNVDVLGNDHAGRLVVGNDWVSPLADLLASSDYRALVGDAARERVVANYDIEVAVAQYRRILRRLQ